MRTILLGAVFVTWSLAVPAAWVTWVWWTITRGRPFTPAARQRHAWIPVASLSVIAVSSAFAHRWWPTWIAVVCCVLFAADMAWQAAEDDRRVSEAGVSVDG